MAYAGLDIGTSGCKMIVYSQSGETLCEASCKYKEFGEGGKREINPTEILAYVKKVIKTIGEKTPETIDSMAIASLGESIVCLDERKESLYNSMIVGDQRGIEEVEYIISKESKQRIIDITGLPPSEMYGLPKYMWLNNNTTAIKQAKYILFYEDYIGYILTGKRMVSYSSASRSMAFDIQNKMWSKELLDYAGIRVSQMSHPVDAGTIIGPILPNIARELKLNQDLKVVVGGHDQSCAALGSGLISTNIGECGMGTCEFMFTMLPKVDKSETMIENDLTCVPYVLPNRYLTSTMITTCGVLKNWSMNTIFSAIKNECACKNENFFEYMDNAIDGKETKVLILPQFGSSGNPDIHYDVYGTITGLTVHTKAEEIYQALLEGMAFQMLLGYESLQEIGVDITQIICTGGGAKSKVTLQMRADLFDIEVATIESEESGTLGCAMLAATAIGDFSDIQDAVKHMVQIKDVYQPNKKRHIYYQSKFKKYKSLYKAMHLFR